MDIFATYPIYRYYKTFHAVKRFIACIPGTDPAWLAENVILRCELINFNIFLGK
jgi:hypothetical protein